MRVLARLTAVSLDLTVAAFREQIAASPGSNIAADPQ
jgi:hypothetical protein